MYRISKDCQNRVIRWLNELGFIPVEKPLNQWTWDDVLHAASLVQKAREQ